MVSAAHHSPNGEHTLAWGMLLSIALHALAIGVLRPFHFDAPVPPRTLQVELQRPEPLPPPPPPPEPVKPQEPPPKPKPELKPQPQTKQTLLESRKVETPAPVPVPATRTAEPPPPPTVIAAVPEPKSEEPPTFTVPPPSPEPPKPAGPSPQDIDAARASYGSLLAREFAKHRQYPRIAQLRGWQGTVEVQLEIDADGNVLNSRIEQSSGYEVLDRQALEMVKKASPLPLPPDVLRGRQFIVDVPVVFRLE